MAYRFLEVLRVLWRSRRPGRFTVLLHRWIVEWTLSWLMRNRRLSKDYERKVHTTQTFNEVTIIRLMLKRLRGKC